MNLDEILQKDLSPDIYCLVHNKIVNLERQCKKQKEVIDRMKEEVKDQYRNGLIAESTKIIILDILKEVSE
jgi:hypothetical protein